MGQLMQVYQTPDCTLDHWIAIETQHVGEEDFDAGQCIYRPSFSFWSEQHS